MQSQPQLQLVEAVVTLEAVLDHNEDHVVALAELHQQAKVAVKQQLAAAGIGKAEVDGAGGAR